MNDKERNDLQLTISHALQEMEAEAGDKFDLSKVNLEELRRRTGIPRKKLRLIKKNGFIVKPHGLSGTRKKDTVLSGYRLFDNAKVITFKGESYRGRKREVLAVEAGTTVTSGMN